MSQKSRAVILSGERGTGKSTLCIKLAKKIRGTGGIVSPGLFDSSGSKIGFDCLDVISGDSWELGRVRAAYLDDDRCGGSGEGGTGKYLFDKTGVLRAVAAIRDSIGRAGGTTLIDEIGPLEFRGGGFAPVLPLLAAAPDLIIVVRPGLIEKLLPVVPVHHVRVFYLTELNRGMLEGEIVSFLKGSN